MKPLKFSEHKDSILDALKSKFQSLGITEQVTLVDGFINQPIQNELTGSFVIGGPTIPMVVLVGNNTGRIYYFALKVLLPNIDE